MVIQTISYSTQINKLLLCLTVIACLSDATAQQTPFTPVSNRVFTPFIINPAIAGSKDFMAIVIQGSDKSLILSGNTRIAKEGPKYFGIPELRDYTQIGVGASLFYDVIGTSRRIGFSAATSWHMPLSKTNLSFLSCGIAVKGYYNYVGFIPDLDSIEKDSFLPNIDAGVYYYGQNLYAGISTTNILGLMLDSRDIAIYDIPVSRQYFFIAGYKLVLIRSLNIVLEPSFIINIDDLLEFNERETYNPMLKLYMDEFCLGTYLHNYDKLTFFFEYKFPSLYLGALVDFPRNAPFFKKELIVEIALGANFRSFKSASQRNWHW
jgi:type IX secretion system PorP/SprF family membrane protein